MSAPEVFKGYTVNGPENWATPKLNEFKAKPFLAHDVLVQIECCGICGSDCHTAQGNWGPHKREDLVVGHEIIGKVLKVGDDVKDISEGQRVGIGAHSSSCGECKLCKSDNEQYCKKQIQTYNSVDYKAGDYITQGGYASHAIANKSHVFPIPESIPSEFAAPLMCAGLTVFSPLFRNLNGDGKGKLVGIVGIGGLGHLGIQFAKALGAKVVAISRSSSKKQEALDFGADEFVATSEETEWYQNYPKDFDLILNCASSFTDLNIDSFLSVVKLGGNICNVGAPALTELMQFHSYQLCFENVSVSGSLVGSKKEAVAMLDLCAKNEIYPKIEKVALNEQNLSQALKRAEKSDVRYRFVLTDFDKAF